MEDFIEYSFIIKIFFNLDADTGRCFNQAAR